MGCSTGPGSRLVASPSGICTHETWFTAMPSPGGGGSRISAASSVLLNAATGDTDHKPRPTLDRVIDRSRAQPAEGVVIMNLFAYRGTDPSVLVTARTLSANTTI
jgi:hypothetical protein